MKKNSIFFKDSYFIRNLLYINLNLWKFFFTFNFLKKLGFYKNITKNIQQNNLLVFDNKILNVNFFKNFYKLYIFLVLFKLIILLLKCKPIHNSTRNKKIIYLLKSANTFYKIKKKNNSSRNISGKKVLLTKKNSLFFDSFRFSNFNFWNKSLSIIKDVLHLKSSCSFCYILKYSSGSTSVVKPISGLFLTDFIKTIMFKPKYYSNTILGFYLPAFFLKKGSIISNIIINKNFKLATSNGTFSQIIFNNKDLNLIIIYLPTKKKLTISYNTFVNAGRNSNIFKKFTIYGKAGGLRNSGKKVKVRGVAMNPVDHPHGGRTKTNSPEVSPWGWVTKNNH